MTMTVQHGFKQEFSDLMASLRTKYGDKLFDIDGIGKQLDVDHFARTFFNTASSGGATADVSIDANANVTHNDAIAFRSEMPKAIMKLNSYYRIWKTIAETNGKELADAIIDLQLSGALYINDVTDVSSPYSYHPGTVVLARINDVIKSVTMEYLFESMSSFAINDLDAECIDTNKFGIEVYDGDKWVKLTRVLRHKSHADLVRFETKRGGMNVVTTDHPVILSDGSERSAGDIVIGDNVAHYDRPSFTGGSKTVGTDMAYLIGAIACDGCVNKSSIMLAQNNVKSTRFYDIISKLFPIVRVSKDGNKLLFGTRKDSEEFSRMIGETSCRKHIPFDFLSWSKQDRLALLAGIVDTDGCVNNKGGTLDLRVSSFSFVQQVADLALSLGANRIRTSIVNVRNRDGSFVSKKPMFRVSFSMTDKELADYSDKIAKNADMVFRERAKDGRWESDAVHKLTVIPWIGEWVYDITTETGTFYSNGIKAHNCWNFSCMDIAMSGLPMVTKIKCGPPKHLTAFKSQIEQFLNVGANSVLGATGLADLLIVMAYYVDRVLETGSDDGYNFRTKKDVWKYVESLITSLVYTLNQPARAGLQSAFTNISVYDSAFLGKMVDGYVFLDGKRPNVKTVKELQRILLDVMNNELDRTPVSFPVITACFSVNEYGELNDLAFAKFIARKNMKYGFINMYCGNTSTLSSCCRLRSNMNDLPKVEREYHNTFGAGSSKIGSLGVVTLNLPRLAWMSIEVAKTSGDDVVDVFKRTLSRAVTLTMNINLARRKLVMERIAEKALPLYDYGFIDLKRQYMTTGLNGMAEACEILGVPVMSRGYSSMMQTIISTVNEVIDTQNASEQSTIEGWRFNVEQTPSENSAIKLAEKDYYCGYNRDENGNQLYQLYSNQFIPLTYKANLLDRITIQGQLDSQFSGGAICHINVEQRVSDPVKIYELIRICARKGVVYWALNYNLCMCENGHMSVARTDTCPECGSMITDTYTRVVG